MRKKILSVVGVGFLALTLAGCGKTSTSQMSNSSGTVSSSTGDSGDSVPVSGDKEIQFWHCIGHDKMRNLQRIIDSFNTAHASTDGYYVKAYQIAGAYDALHDAVKTKLNAGYVPSITMGYPDSFAEYIGSNGGDKSKILKLDDMMAADTKFNSADFVSQYYNEGTGYQYSGTYSLPLYKSTEVMYYNIDAYQASAFYKALGANDSYGNYGAHLKDPSTWDFDTLLHVAGMIQEENKATSDFHALGYDSDSNLFISQMAQRGIPYTTSSGTSAEHFLYVNPSTGKPNADLQSLLSTLYTTTQNGVLVTQGSYGSYASDLFKQKKVMFTIGSTGGSAYNEPNGTFKCGLASVPSYQGNKKYIMQGPSLCFFNTKNATKQKAAFDFYANYIADPELNAQLALENSYDPVKTASYQTASYKGWVADGLTSDGKDDVTADLQYRIPNLTSTLTADYMTTPVFIGSATARTEIGNLIQYTKENNGNVEQAIMKAYTNSVLAA
jgi:hypothetical protein